MKINLNNMDAVEIYKLVLNKQIGKFPNGFWQRPEAEQNSINCIKYLLEEKLKWDKKTIKNELRLQTFIDNKLSGMMQLLYNSKPYKALEATYPNEYKFWDLAQTAKDYWNEESAIYALKYTIEKRLKWNKEAIKQNVSKQILVDNGLYMVYKMFGGVYEAINKVYPNEFKTWHLKCCPNNYWNKTTAFEAIKYELENNKWTIDDIKTKLSTQFFKDNKLTTALTFFDSIYDVINQMYPNQLEPWQLTTCPQGYWKVVNKID